MDLETQKGAPREEIAELYRTHGAVVLRNFYDPERDIAPIAEDVRQIIEFISDKHGIAVDCSTAKSAMTKGYEALIKADRRIGGEVYDAVKQIPAFMRLVADPRNAELYAGLKDDCVPGLAAGGYGIRIDNPREEKFRAQWHQEFPAQLRSIDGIVFWSPLMDVTPEMGPVQVLPGSHGEGYLDVYQDDAGAGKSGAYALFMRREAEVVENYPRAAPLMRVGDLLIMDFLTVHQSGYNVADRPRWSMQFRYFNFADPVGRSIGWRGSFAAGVDFRSVIGEAVGSHLGRGATESA